jgi:hypothetical protein
LFIESDGKEVEIGVRGIKKKFSQLTGKEVAAINQTLVTHQTKLEEGGWITTSSAAGAGVARGWTLVNSKRYEQFKNNLLETLFSNPKDPMFLDALSMDFEEIVDKMDNPPPNLPETKKGKFFEIFAARIAFKLGLRDIRMNVLDEHMERDVLAKINNPFFARFLIQCKNWAGKIGMPIIVKEIGIAMGEKFDYILFFSRNGYVSGTEATVDGYMRSTGVKIYLFNREDINLLIQDSKKLDDIVQEKNLHIGQVMEGTDPFVEGLTKMIDFKTMLEEKGWTAPK